jgi:hypothetical protein
MTQKAREAYTTPALENSLHNRPNLDRTDRRRNNPTPETHKQGQGMEDLPSYESDDILANGQ